MFQGKRTQTFRTLNSNHENPAGTESLEPFRPEFVGNFKTSCRERRTEHTEILTEISAKAVVELYLRAENFNVFPAERGMKCQVLVTETQVPPGCPEPVPQERTRKVSANAKYNAGTTLPGVPANPYALNHLEADTLQTWY